MISELPWTKKFEAHRGLIIMKERKTVDAFRILVSLFLLPLISSIIVPSSANHAYASIATPFDSYFFDSASNSVRGDFNGDGLQDAAGGHPSENNNTGTVIVGYSCENGCNANQLWTQNTADIDGIAEYWDVFGGALSSADFNGDGFDDLAIGVPYEDIDLAVASPQNFDESINSGIIKRGAGVVQIIYGSPNGLSANIVLADQVVIQGFENVNDSVENHDLFGRSLSSGDFNGDGFDDLVVGVENEDDSHAGSVQIVYGSPQGLSANAVLPDQVWTQNSLDIQEGIDEQDFFGTSLSTGDFNGDGFDELAIGVPYEDYFGILPSPRGGASVLGLLRDVGGVNVIYGSQQGLSANIPIFNQFWSQSPITSPNMDDYPEMYENFGYYLASGDVNRDGFEELYIWVPGEYVPMCGYYSGVWHKIYGSANGLSATVIPDELIC